MIRDANLRGAAFMTLSMAGFAVEDVFLKAAAQTVPVGQVLIVMGALGTIFFHTLARRRGERAFAAEVVTRGLVIRSVFEVAGRLFYALAIALTPLSSAVAILQAAPIFVVVGAATLFGEKVGWRRWSAIAVGFAGVLVILRPGVEGFSWLSLLAVAGMLGFAGRDLATRAAPPGLSNVQLGAWGFAMLTVAGVVLTLWDGRLIEPDAREIALMLAAAVFGVAGYHALTVAMRTGEVGAVTPFRYTRLVFAVVLAVVVFDERPDAVTLIGSAIVVAAGVYTLRRGARVQR